MIKLRNNRKYRNFTTLETSNAITRQWNDIKFKSGKKQVSIDELEYIISKTTNEKIYEEALELYNVSAKRSNRQKGTDYKVYDIYAFSKRNIKKEIETNKNKLRKEKVEKLIEEIGFGKYMKEQLYTKIGNEYIPNPKMVGKSFESIKKDLEKKAKLAGYSQEELDEVIAKRRDEYDIFLKEVRKINKGKASAIEEATSKRLDTFLYGGIRRGRKHAGYFGYLMGHQIEKAKLNALLERLNTGEKLAVENLMIDNQFLKQWCSDQDCEDDSGEFRINRLEEVIKIIENYLGEGVEVDPSTGDVRYYKLSSERATDTSLRLETFIGR